MMSRSRCPHAAPVSPGLSSDHAIDRKPARATVTRRRTAAPVTARDLPLTFLIMASRIVRILLSVLLIPVLTGIGMAPCTAMGQSAAMPGTSTRAVPPTSQHHARRADNDPAKAPLDQHKHAPCDNSTGTNCCPAVTGCSAIALPSTVATPQATTAIVTSVHAAYQEPPIALAVAPEPPPPKA